jgi:hypothetical protein
MPNVHERAHTQGRSGAALWTRVLGGGVAVGAMLAIVAGVGGVPGAAAAVPMKNCGYNCEHYSWICRYHTEPGGAEHLVPGDNPVWVKNVNLLSDDWYVRIEVGQQFTDGQDRSVVIIANLDDPYLDPAPTTADCPPPTSPTTTTTTATSPPTATTTTTTTTTSTSSAPSTTRAAAPVAAATTYSLHPVKAGVVSGPGADVTPGRAGLLVAALVGLWALVSGGRRPRLRPVRPRRQ